ncbi:uncharacterized protein LOC115410625 [Sphaeramia orbicularis]|uniref:uncharacterized protein LOC115410625 n=1 Tax=Sphaeramia orbicularis TaxID=375764 RepID=UPI00117F07A7|nr:uncharacterized protein LOC115410625 [Sphaeramia orbicularis]XP_029978210.1 uncharacterized protein LOC115410625 [Sphaeramia orbicularis]XP_029978211.1 uncharacterized protein LOC115410625 [Sphaeramia orbicularis]
MNRSCSVNGSAAGSKWSLRRNKPSNGSCVRLRGQTTESKESPDPKQDTRGTPGFPSMDPQRRWSADVSTCGSPPIIIVKKNKKEPQPPQRGVSLLRPHPPCHDPAKRYSCPPIRTLTPPTTPPPVQTYTITGPDPLGWKLRPKSGFASPRTHTARLSLQIPLPDTIHEVKFYPNSCMASISQTTPPFESHHRHRRSQSDCSGPAVTLEQIYAVQLRNIVHETDDVYSEVNDEKSRGPHKIPPPVAEKTPIARQMAKQIAQSCRRYAVTMNVNEEEPVYSSVIKPTRTHSQ